MYPRMLIGRWFEQSLYFAVHMHPEHAFVTELLSRAVDAPESALVELWCRLDHTTFELEFNRDRCRAQADICRSHFEKPRPLPAIHPAAALRAISRRVSEGRDGFEAECVEIDCGHCGRAYYVVRRPGGWRSRVGEARAGHREYWLEGLQIVPARHGDGAGDFAIEVVDLPAHVRRRLGAESLRFVAGGFDDAVQPDWHGPPYWSRGLTDRDTRWSTLQAILGEAADHRAECLVLPELTLDPDLRRLLCGWLRDESHDLALVLAGSYHEVEPETGIRRNVSYLLDGDGREIRSQRKLNPMRTMKGDQPLDEDVQGYNATVLLRSSFGLIGIAICLDFCVEDTGPLSSLWKAVGPALMLVPSMGGVRTNRRHRARAEVLSEIHATATLIASQHPEDDDVRQRQHERRVAKNRVPGDTALEPRCLGISASSEQGDFQLAEGSPLLRGEVTWPVGSASPHDVAGKLPE